MIYSLNSGHEQRVQCKKKFSTWKCNHMMCRYLSVTTFVLHENSARIKVLMSKTENRSRPSIICKAWGRKYHDLEAPLSLRCLTALDAEGVLTVFIEKSDLNYNLYDRSYKWVWISSCFFSEPWQLSVGVLQVQCDPAVQDGVGRLAVCRGLLTCCRPHILLSSRHDATQVNLLNLCGKHLSLVCAFISRPITSFLRRVYFWKVCFLLFTLCVKRSWTVTT